VRRFAPAVLAAIACALAAGCASVPLGAPSLHVTVVPETLYAGDVVTVSVTAPEGTRDVYGRLDVGGSPTLPLKTKDHGRTWTFVTQVPLGATWPPGRYKVIVQGKDAQGAPLYGEAWVNAP
jgi:hypothetical protein